MRDGDFEVTDPATEPPVAIYGAEHLDLAGVRFVIDLDITDLQLLIASINVVLEHPNMRTEAPSALALVAAYSRMRDELWRMVNEQLEAPSVGRQVRKKVVRRRWVRPAGGEGDGEPDPAVR